jgi:hypothetical protein
MLKRIWAACAAMCLALALSTGSARAASSEASLLDRYASNPFATALAVAAAGISVATAANAVAAAATAIGSTAEVMVAGVTVIGGASMATVVLTGIGIATVLYVGTADLTAALKAAGAAAQSPQGK